MLEHQVYIKHKTMHTYSAIFDTHSPIYIGGFAQSHYYNGVYYETTSIGTIN